jgi:hypothetical protein
MVLYRITPQSGIDHDLVSVVKILLKAFFLFIVWRHNSVRWARSYEMRHVIHDTRISSGQCPRRDVTVRFTRSYGIYPRGKTHTCQKLIHSFKSSPGIWRVHRLIHWCYSIRNTVITLCKRGSALLVTVNSIYLFNNDGGNRQNVYHDTHFLNCTNPEHGGSRQQAPPKHCKLFIDLHGM